MDTISRRRLLYATQKHRKDALIEFIRAELNRCFALYDKKEINTRYLETMAFITDMISEHRRNPEGSRLHRIVPTVSKFFTDLDLTRAYTFYNQKARFSQRSFVPPSFNEIRDLLNVAQVHATCTDKVQMISFDGDQTLYSDGSCISNQSIIDSIVRLLQDGVVIAIVTAASYLDNASGYERRIDLLLQHFRQVKLPAEKLSNFYVLGGECNYLFQCNKDAHLEYIDPQRWQPGVFDYSPADVVPVLDKAQSVIETCVAELGIQARLIRKERAVGIIPKVPGHRLKREALDETAYAVSSALKKQFLNVPFCSFNGGNDVFVDIGDKSIGIRGLLKLTGIAKEHCLHVGDQFFSHGNDYACRDTCATIWITSPKETAEVLDFVISEVEMNTQPATASSSDAGGAAKRARIEGAQTQDVK
eukprot:INCI7089.2.p1 GENE.INCI7089.2~~INCI7089.2.p1  ORF type:complete len:418 (-),score=70.33 INCI7089.2:559-1812(-)